MTTLFAPPELLSVYSYAVDGSDPDIPKGTHLRVFAGLGASFPLTPFAVFKIVSRNSEPRDLHITDREGKQVDGLYLSQLGAAEVTPLLGDTNIRRTVRIELVPDAVGGIRGAKLLDKEHRVVAERNTDRFLFSAPVMHKFRLWGAAEHVEVHTQSVHIDDVVSRRISLEAAGILGLPIQGLHPWYFGVQDRRDSLNRVANGAPMRLNPMDQPDGPFNGVGPDEEVARVEAMLNSTQLAGGLEKLVLKLVDDESKAPWLQVESQEMRPEDGGTKQFAQVPRLGNLQMAALDPGVARFLGFADRIDDLPDLEGDHWNALAIAGLFVIDPKHFDPFGRLGAWLNEPDPNEATLIEMITRALNKASGNDVQDKIKELIVYNQNRGLLVRAFVAVTAPVPPWMPPSLPKPSLIQHRWQTAIHDKPSSLYRASFAFEQPPLASMAAMGGQFDGIWKSRHKTVDVGGFETPIRSNPRIFGHEQEAFSRARELKLSTATSERAGLLADQDIPADAGTIYYRFRASDFFGRFGESAEFEVRPPPRPAPPPPVLRFHIEQSGIDLASSEALSPGKLKLTFAVPQSALAERFSAADKDKLASAIAVPTISELAAGSKQLKRANITLDGQSQSVDLTITGLTEVMLPLPKLLPQETQTLTLTATFTNTDGIDSAPATQSVKITDIRPPKAYPTGIGLFWTSSPGPSPETELQLAWPAPPGSLHRVYITDQQGLALTAEDLAEPAPGAAPSSRGRVAQIGCNKVLGGAPGKRTSFRLLTDKPIIAGADGRAVLETKLPRSLETVQFLRVVPLSAEGAEAPFDTCGIVPVAVPDSRRPPSPRLDGIVDPETGIAELTIIATGFDGIGLQRDEPGLFNPGADGATPPEFRVRRAVGAVADPIYARTVATGILTRDAAMAPALIFSGIVNDDNAGRGLEPFVRYVYWADVRLPPERRVPAGVLPLDPPGGITAVDPSNAENHPRPMSLPSAPRVLMHAPRNPPTAPLREEITATRKAPNAMGAVEITIEIANPPIAHVKAIGPYRLAVWTQWPDQDIQAVIITNGEPLNGTWPDFSDGAISVTVAPPSPLIDLGNPITLRLAFVDPMGRLSDLTTIDVP